MNRIIANVIESTRKSFNDSLRVYWCAYRGREKESDPKDNDVSERNISFHFCKELWNNGFKIYSEVGHNTSSGTLGRLDYLAINAETDTLLAIEAKRVHGSASIGSMLNDIERVRSFQIQRLDDYHSGNQIENRFGIVIGITWDKDVRDHWINLSNEQMPRPHENWRILSKRVRELNASFDAIPVGGPEVADYDSGWIVYCVFKTS